MVDVVEEVGVGVMLDVVAVVPVVGVDPLVVIAAEAEADADADIIVLKLPLWNPHAPNPLVRLDGDATAAFAAQLL